MAADVFVNWTTSSKPTRDETATVIRDFFGDVATEIRWDTDRFFVTLVGKWSSPLARVVDDDVRRHLLAGAPESPDDGRYLEVWLGDDALDVLTRHQDEFTHACQDGLAAVFARRWRGRVVK